MLSVQWVAVVLAAAVLAVWVYRCIVIHTPSARGPVLCRESVPEMPPAGLVSILVPAKDEESNIAAAIETLLAQDYPEIEIIVVDDRSRDRTAEIVRELAARDPRVRLVQVAELPPGWFGKPHAMHVGAGQARGEWLLFVDADCRQAPHSVRAAVNFLTKEGGQMLSLWPVLEMHGFWEKVVLPVAGSVLVAWFRPTWVNNPKYRTAFANGQYIMIHHATYAAVKGYESVRTEIVEDIALARHVKHSGHRLLNAVSTDLFTTRMHDSPVEMYKGWSRIYYGAFKSVGWLAAVISLTFLFTLAPFMALTITAAIMAIEPAGAFIPAMFFLSLGTTVVIFVTMRRYCIAGSANPWYLFFYPIAVTVVMACQAGAVLRALGLRSITWRGTTYKGNHVVSE